MAGYTKTFSVGSGADVAIVADIRCASLVIGEDASVANWPTTDYIVKKPSTGNTGRQIPIGTNYIFEKDHGFEYMPGEIAGYIRTVTGTTTFFVDENGR